MSPDKLKETLRIFDRVQDEEVEESFREVEATIMENRGSPFKLFSSLCL